jgi:hypothetical protein
MIFWVLSRVDPKYFIGGVCILLFGMICTLVNIDPNLHPLERDLLALSGTAQSVTTRCSRRHSCSYFLSLDTSSSKFSLAWCHGAEDVIAIGDPIGIHYKPNLFGKGGTAYAIVRGNIDICTYDRAVQTQQHFSSVNLAIGVLALILGVLLIGWSFISAARHGYRWQE